MDDMRDEEQDLRIEVHYRLTTKQINWTAAILISLGAYAGIDSGEAGTEIGSRDNKQHIVAVESRVTDLESAMINVISDVKVFTSMFAENNKDFIRDSSEINNGD